MDQYLGNRDSRGPSASASKLEDDELLEEIGYRPELTRTYTTWQIFAVPFSIMGILPSVASNIGTGLMCGGAGLVWGWFAAGALILSIGISMSILASAIPTSGGLYYWTYYYAPEKLRVVLSFLIGISNTLGLISGFCSINYGCAAELLAAVYIQRDGNFTTTDPIMYGVFAACCISHIGLVCATSLHKKSLQYLSMGCNVFLVVLFLVTVPIGVAQHSGFNSREFIFGKMTNARDWPTGWSFMLSWMPAIWSIGGFDSCVYMSEEAKNATKGVPIGIIGSIGVCWLVGWVVCIVATASIKDGDIEAVLSTDSGQVMAQIIHDALGKNWAVAFMSMIAFSQYFMGASILTSTSRQMWAFARDDGLPLHSYIKVINPAVKAPVRATIFGGILGLLCGLLILIGPTAANALFSLAVASCDLSWGMPVLLVLMPAGAKKFQAGYFNLGRIGNTLVHVCTVTWISYVIVMCMFPTEKKVDKESMNYTVVINVGVWLLALAYYFIYGHKVYSGPKSNIDTFELESSDEIVYEKVEGFKVPK